MSLINEALKRARESQKSPIPPAAPNLQFRPVEPMKLERGPGWGLPLALTAMAVLGMFFIWELSHDRKSKTSPPDLVARAASNPAPPPATVEPPSVATEPATAAIAPETVAPEPASIATVEEPPTPKLPVLRLQGILYNPTHPSAMINGRTVSKGDKVQGFRVGLITQDSATLFNETQTNTLSLSE